MNRNWQVYVKGLALGLPLVALFTLVNAYGKVKTGLETSWDESINTRVLSKGASLGRTMVTATLYMLVIFAIDVWDRENERTLNQEMPRQSDFAVPDPYRDQLRSSALELKAISSSKT